MRRFCIFLLDLIEHVLCKTSIRIDQLKFDCFKKFGIQLFSLFEVRNFVGYLHHIIAVVVVDHARKIIFIHRLNLHVNDLVQNKLFTTFWSKSETTFHNIGAQFVDTVCDDLVNDLINYLNFLLLKPVLHNVCQHVVSEFVWSQLFHIFKDRSNQLLNVFPRNSFQNSLHNTTSVLVHTKLHNSLLG